MKKKIMKLKNLYSGEIVLTDSYDEFEKVNDIEFIKVWNPNVPGRKFLVNRQAFRPVTK